MNIKDLRIFTRIAALQSLSGVAASLGVSAGTVSKRIQSLEDDLGVRLVDRTTRSCRLTEEGRMFLQRAERILAEIDLAADEISANTGQPAGRISLTAPACLAERLVKPAILSFIQAYPGVEIRVDISDTIVNLHEHGYDAAIRFGNLPDSTLKARRLASDRIVMVASPAYLDARGTPRQPAALSAHDCLVLSEQRIWQLQQDGARTAIRVSGRIVSDNGDFLRSAALAGAGILRISEIAVHDELASGRLVEVLSSNDAGSDAGIWALYPNNRHAMPRLRALIDHLATYCRDQFSIGSDKGDRTPASAPRRHRS
jgi:DNA-binding transcriptional LysR family regulator